MKNSSYQHRNLWLLFKLSQNKTNKKNPFFTNLFVNTRFDAPSPSLQQSYSSLMQLQDSQESHNNKLAVPHIRDVVSLWRGDHSKAPSTRDRLGKKYGADLHEHSKPVFGQYAWCKLRSTIFFSFIPINCQNLSRSLIERHYLPLVANKAIAGEPPSCKIFTLQWNR